MKFEDFLKEKAAKALESAAESRTAAPDSWGAAYDCGYSDALNFLLAGLPSAISQVDLTQRDALVRALETAAGRFNMMAGVGLVNGADPKVGYRECMEALKSCSVGQMDVKP